MLFSFPRKFENLFVLTRHTEFFPGDPFDIGCVVSQSIYFMPQRVYQVPLGFDLLGFFFKLAAGIINTLLAEQKNDAPADNGAGNDPWQWFHGGATIRR
jgi:hypothetical protein